MHIMHFFCLRIFKMICIVTVTCEKLVRSERKCLELLINILLITVACFALRWMHGNPTPAPVMRSQSENPNSSPMRKPGARQAFHCTGAFSISIRAAMKELSQPWPAADTEQEGVPGKKKKKILWAKPLTHIWDNQRGCNCSLYIL